MFTIGYAICLFICGLVLIYMALRNYENIDIYYWSALIVIPIVILGYWLQYRILGLTAARVSISFITIGNTILPVMFLFVMMRFLKLKAEPWVKLLAYGLAFFYQAIIWLMVDREVYYKEYSYVKTDSGYYAGRITEGPLRRFDSIFMLLVVLAFVIIMIIGFVKKGGYTRGTLIRNYIFLSLALGIYMFEEFVHLNFSLRPYLYCLVEILLAVTYDKIHIHDISALMSAQQDIEQGRAYLALDFRRRFLCCNQSCYELIPELKSQRLDTLIEADGSRLSRLLGLIEEFKENKDARAEFQVEDKTYICEVSYFSIRKNAKNMGYLIYIRDATAEKRNLDILNNYNEVLSREVGSKVKHIRSIQRNLVMGMANMIENRDNNTGGHVKRTSDVIAFLVDEIIKQGKFPISEQIAEDIVRAAPMHDLGKLHIDSNILCKPARLTDEEFAIMKTHSVKSGEIVMILLKDIEEEHFVKTAYNIARFHHERWDGRGYPEGLVGGMIPLEARIMAVADVYDALVSKRCYKEPMSFEKAETIMCESMGTQFDPNMKQIFLACKDKLENYYRKVNEQ